MSQDFDTYIRQGEPSQQAKAYAWQTAIGLQDVDGLRVSGYLKKTAEKHIEGSIDINEAKRRVEEYYSTHQVYEETRTEEADKVATRITQILSEDAFSFRPTILSSIHRRLFTGILKDAGEYRTFNITKNEWVLNGESVVYAPFEEIANTLAYDFEKESSFDYSTIFQRTTKETREEAIATHLSSFIANIWQVHPFSEGNSRTMAVFVIKYLRQLGYTALTNAPYASHARYFRDTLVRANYSDIKVNVKSTLQPLSKILTAVISNAPIADDSFRSRDLHISNCR